MKISSRLPAANYGPDWPAIMAPPARRNGYLHINVLFAESMNFQNTIPMIFALFVVGEMTLIRYISPMKLVSTQ